MIATDTVADWFVRSRDATPDSFESVIAVEVARLSSQVGGNKHEDDTSFLYRGSGLSYFVDFLFVLLDNCVTKSGLNDGLWINTSFKQDGQQLKIVVANNCKPITDIDIANSDLDFYRQHYGKEAYALQAAQGEGGSGFFKVWKALTKDLELPHTIEFGYVTFDVFEVKITVELHHLTGVLFHENSSS